MGDTIVALASGKGRSGIALIRISGPSADAILVAMTGGLPDPRRATVRLLRDAAGDILDQALILWFPAGQSYTSECMAELHCHGGRAVISAVLDTVLTFEGARLADPGEFTLRAFQAGRLSLADVEALGDLISAETELQRRQSIQLFDGAVSRRAAGWRTGLLRALALVEVTIDWADEEVPEDVEPEVGDLIRGMLEEMRSDLELSDGAERLRDGFEVALVGAPNSGKSSFINMLSGRETAITSEIVGTTRDVVELRYDLNGLPVIFLDMAGLRETSDKVESLGVQRALERASNADMRLLLFAEDAPFPEEYQYLQSKGDVWVRTKGDIDGRFGVSDHVISSISGHGVSDVLGAVSAILGEKAEGAGLFGHKRQQQAVLRAQQALGAALVGLASGMHETVADDLRLAIDALKELVGELGTEDVLGEVFTSFCIGK